MQRALAALDDLRALLQHQHGGAAHVADVDWLVARVQHQHPAANRHVWSVPVQPVPDGGDTRPVLVGGGMPSRRRNPRRRSPWGQEPYVRVVLRVHRATIVNAALFLSPELDYTPGIPLTATG